MYETGGDAAVYEEMIGLIAAKLGPLPLVFEIFNLVLVQYLQQFLLPSLLMLKNVSFSRYVGKKLKTKLFQTGQLNYTLVNFFSEFLQYKKLEYFH